MADPARRPRGIPRPDIDRALASVRGDRDRVLDLVRAWSICVVVAGHSLMAVVMWRHGRPELGNTLATYPWLQPATWFLQVLPLFFMVGAAASAKSWTNAQHRGEPYARWIWHRMQRLLRPVIVYLAVMSTIGFAIGGLDDPAVAEPLLRLTTQLLWFLGAYLWVTAAVPALVRLPRRASGAAMVLVVCSVAVIDWVRLRPGGPLALGLVNFLAVWMLVALIGVRMDELVPRTRASVLLAAGVAVDVLLVTVADYPVSMVGMPGDAISNMDPPTIVLVVHAITMYAAVTLLRPWLTRVAASARVWRATVAVNMLMMSVYLWHLPVLTALTVLEHVIGRERPMHWRRPVGPVPAEGFWPWTVPHLAVFLVALLLVLRVAWIAEYRPLPWWDSEPRVGAPAATVSAVIGVALAGIGISVISATGLAGFPSRISHYQGVPMNAGVAALLTIVGVVLVRAASRRRV